MTNDEQTSIYSQASIHSNRDVEVVSSALSLEIERFMAGMSIVPLNSLERMSLDPTRSSVLRVLAESFEDVRHSTPHFGDDISELSLLFNRESSVRRPQSNEFLGSDLARVNTRMVLALESISGQLHQIVGLLTDIRHQN
jgi:hypothetical protein